MADAFRCDECDDYYDGDPAEEVYVRRDHTGRSVHDLRAELCEECSQSFAGGPPADDEEADR